MCIKKEIIENQLLLKFEKETLDISNCREFQNKFDEIIHEEDLNNYKTCILDLSNTQYVDSTGLKIMLNLYVFFRGKGKVFKLEGVSEQFQHLLDIFRIKGLFSIE